MQMLVVKIDDQVQACFLSHLSMESFVFSASRDFRHLNCVLRQNFQVTQSNPLLVRVVATTTQASMPPPFYV